MKRDFDMALMDLRRALIEWVRNGARPGIRIFVYPPEWEARMLAQFPSFVEQVRNDITIDIEDVGAGFLAEMERPPSRVCRMESLRRSELLHDLGEIGSRYLRRIMRQPLEAGDHVRLLVNTGSLGTFVSYSAITTDLYGDGPQQRVAAPTVIAFPGEGDETQLNLLYLRSDTNYRVPRI